MPVCPCVWNRQRCTHPIYGYFEHLEMEMMAEAGMSPMDILVSATKNVAEYLELEGLGTLAPSHYADFIILDANPLQGDIPETPGPSAKFLLEATNVLETD